MSYFTAKMHQIQFESIQNKKTLLINQSINQSIYYHDKQIHKITKKRT